MSASTSAHAPVSRESARPAKKLYGRDDAISKVLRTLGQATSARAPQTILVTGEGGSGKTRFMLEAESHIRSSNPTVTVAYGRALAQHSENNGFQPIREAMADLIYELQNQDGNPMLGRLRRSLRETAPDWLEAVPAVGSLLKAAAKTLTTTLEEPEKTISLGTSLTAQFTDLVKELIEAGPLVLLLDDLHWADASTVDLIYTLTQTITDGPFVLICAYREADLQLDENRTHPLFETLLRIERYTEVIKIPLGGLNREDIQRIASDTLDVIVDLRTAERLEDLTGGNPLFVHEYLGLALDRAGRGTKAVRSSDLINHFALETPRRVEAIIEERLTKLTPSQVRLLEVASVLGPVFSPDELLQLADLDRGEARAALRALCRRHALIHPIPDSSPPRYSFHHVTVRQVLDRKLAEADPFDYSELHTAAATMLRNTGRSDLETLELIAHHAMCAGDIEAQLRDSLAAASVAWRLGLANECLRLLTAPVDSLQPSRSIPPGTVPQAVALRLRAHNAVADHEGAVRCYQQLEAKFGPGLSFSASMKVAHARSLRMVNEWAIATEVLQELLQYNQHGPAITAEAMLLLGQIQLCGTPQNAESALESFSEARDNAPDPTLESQAVGHIGLTNLVLARTTEAFRELDAAIEIARTSSNLVDAYEAIHWRSKAEIACLKIESGLRSVSELKQISERTGIASTIPFHLRDQARLLGLGGELEASAKDFLRYYSAVDSYNSIRLAQRCRATLACHVLELRGVLGQDAAEVFGTAIRATPSVGVVSATLVKRAIDVALAADSVANMLKALVDMGVCTLGTFEASEAIFRFDIPDLGAFRRQLTED